MRQGLGIATNNAAEYHGLILGLRHAIERGYKKIKVKGDSKLICMQVRQLKSFIINDLCIFLHLGSLMNESVRFYLF